MRQFTILLIFITSFMSAFSQKDKVYLSEIYQDLESKTLVEKVVSCDSMSSEGIMLKFENFSGTAFVNYDNVTNSKTGNQIVLNYVQSTATISWNVRVIVKFKDNRFKISIVDDGNVYVPSSYAGSVRIPAKPARSIYLSDFFRGDYIEYKIKPGLYNAKEKQASTVKRVKKSADDFIRRLEEYMVNDNSSDDEW